jgi:hypothetical protein
VQQASGAQTQSVFAIAAFTKALLLSGCATLATSDLPACANVHGFYNPDISLGAERLGTRLRFERRLTDTSGIG